MQEQASSLQLLKLSLGHVGLQCFHGGLGCTQEIAFCFANPGVESAGLNSFSFGNSLSFFKEENKTQGIFHHHHGTDEDRFCGCGQQHFLNCFVLSFAVPITESINTRRLTGFSTALCTAAERKREHLSCEPECRRSNTLNAQHMDALVSFVLAGIMHAALPQLLEQQSSQAWLLKHTASKAFLLTCHCLHFLQQKRIHHVQKLDTLSVGMEWPAVPHSEEIVHFPRVGGSVYVKHSCEVLWSLISVLTALLSAITRMEKQKVNADAFFGLVRLWVATKQLAGAVLLAWSCFSLLPQPSWWHQYWRDQMSLCYCNSRLTSAGLAPAGSFSG